MTDETFWLDALLSSAEAAELRQAITDTAEFGTKALSIVPSAVLHQAIEATISKALHLDLLALFAQGWALAADIKAYGDPKRHPKGTTAVLKLGKHAIERDIKPVITIDIGAAKRFPVDLTIALAATFQGIEISIRDAAIVAVGSGSCDITAKLVLARSEVWTKTLANRRLPGVHRFREPIAIPFVHSVE